MEGFAVLGTIIVASVPAICFSVFGGQRPGFCVFAMGVGFLLTVLYMWQCYKIKERPDYYTRESNPIVPGVRHVMRNGPARIPAGHRYSRQRGRLAAARSISASPVDLDLIRTHVALVELRQPKGGVPRATAA